MHSYSFFNPCFILTSCAKIWKRLGEFQLGPTLRLIFKRETGFVRQWYVMMLILVCSIGLHCFTNEIFINQTQGISMNHNQQIKTAGHGTESQECCKSTDMNLHSNQSFTLLSNVKMAQEQLV